MPLESSSSPPPGRVLHVRTEMLKVLRDFNNLLSDLTESDLPPAARDDMTITVATATAKVQEEYELLVSSNCCREFSDRNFQQVLVQQQALSVRRLVRLSTWVDDELAACASPSGEHPPHIPLESPTEASMIGSLLESPRSSDHENARSEAPVQESSEHQTEAAGTRVCNKLAFTKSDSKVYIDVEPAIDGAVVKPMNTWSRIVLHGVLDVLLAPSKGGVREKLVGVARSTFNRLRGSVSRSMSNF